MQGSAGGSRSGWGAASSGGARPQTAEIIKTLGERCPQVTVNARSEVSDYVVKLDHEGGKGYLRKDNKVAVFVQSSGDSIFSKSTMSLGGAVQDACVAMTAHWSAHAAEFDKNALHTAPSTVGTPAVSAVVSATAGSAPMAGLQIDSSVPGADIEIDGAFAGNTPSTLSVPPGAHTITVKKKGYTDWTRTMNVSGAAVHLTAELDATK
ncbi:MAG: PEGA domain-containing protein [Janthinobacterium lividum]